MGRGHTELDDLLGDEQHLVQSHSKRRIWVDETLRWIFFSEMMM